MEMIKILRMIAFIVVIAVTIVSVQAASLNFMTNPIVQDGPFGKIYPACSSSSSLAVAIDAYTGESWSSSDASYWNRRANAPNLVAATSAVLANGNVLLFGGSTYQPRFQYSNSVHVSTDALSTWELSTNAAPWSARAQAQATVIPGTNTVILVGGFNGANMLQCDTCPPTNSTWISTDGSGKVWTETISSPASSFTNQLSYAALVALGDVTSTLILAGGWSAGLKNDVFISQDLGHSWQAYVAPWSPRMQHSLVADSSNNLYLVGGNSKELAWFSSDKGVSWTQMDLSPSFSTPTVACATIREDENANKQLILYAGYQSSPSAVTHVGIIRATISL